MEIKPYITVTVEHPHESGQTLCSIFDIDKELLGSATNKTKFLEEIVTKQLTDFIDLLEKGPPNANS